MPTKSILVVEDEGIIASDIKHTLTSLGYHVAAVVGTGADAVAKAEELRPGLILMDIVLCGAMTGIEAAQVIRSRLDIPIVYLTAFADDEMLQCAKATDPFGYLLKPFEGRELQIAIEMALYKHQAARQLRESETRFRELYERAPLGYLSLDAGGALLEVNQAWLELTGYTRDEVKGRALADFLAPEWTARFLDGSTLFGTAGRIDGLSLDLIRRDGSRITVSLEGRTTCDASGVIRQTHCIMHDITERKRAEQALNDSEDRYRRLVELSPDAIYVQADGKIAFINHAGARLFGAESPGQLLGMPVLDRMHPDFRSIVTERIRVLRDRQGEAPRLEQRFLRLDGSAVDVDVSATAFTYQGKPGVQVIARDISRQKQREREMEAVISLSAALRAASTQAEMMPIIMDLVLSLMQADGGLLVLRDQATRELIFALGQGVWAWATGKRLGPGQGITARVMDTRQPYANMNTREDAGLARPDLLGDLLGDLSVTTCVPLIMRGQSIGALWVGFLPVAGRRLMGEGELRVLTALADIAASALHRSALHEETQRRLEHITALHTIDTAISASLDLRVTLEVLLTQVTAQLNVDGASVLLFSAASQTLSHAAERGYLAGPLARIRLGLGEGYAGRAARERTTLYCADLREAGDADPRARRLVGEGFVSSYSVPLVGKGQVKGILEVYHRQTLTPDQEWLEFLGTLAGQAAIAVENAELFEQLQLSNSELALAYESTLEGWSKAMDLRDRETEGHTLRAADLTVRLAQAVGASPADVVQVRRGALLHDIGKMGVPDSILLKPGPLTPEEWEVMRRHPDYAYDMLSPITYLRQALEIPYCHHEKWDGAGYPRGLKAEQIPLGARIFAVVDVWDALTTDRPYRLAWPVDEARQHIQEQAGKHFDPQVVRAFLAMLDGQEQARRTDGRLLTGVEGQLRCPRLCVNLTPG